MSYEYVRTIWGGGVIDVRQRRIHSIHARHSTLINMDTSSTNDISFNVVEKGDYGPRWSPGLQGICNGHPGGHHIN